MTENPYEEMIRRQGIRKVPTTYSSLAKVWNEGYAAGDIDGFKRYIHLICDILEDQMMERSL